MSSSATTGLFYRDLGAWWLHDDSRWRPSIEKNDRKRGWRISAGRAPQYLSGLERAGNAVFSATPNMARQFLYQQLVHIRDLNPVQPLAGMTVSAPCRATKQAARLADVRTWKPSEPIKPLAIMSFTSASEQCLTSASEQSATESPLKALAKRIWARVVLDLGTGSQRQESAATRGGSVRETIQVGSHAPRRGEMH